VNLAERIKSDLDQAIKQNDTKCRSALRLVLAGIQNEEKSQQKKLDDAGIIDILTREVKKRRESIEAFEQGNRSDLVAQEKAALDIVSKYLPQQMSRDEIVAAAEKVIEDIAAKGPGDKGKVMSQLVPQTKGRADGKAVNDIVTELLNNI
jgi:uncharacterized protein YqeY